MVEDTYQALQRPLWLTHRDEDEACICQDYGWTMYGLVGPVVDFELYWKSSGKLLMPFKQGLQ